MDTLKRVTLDLPAPVVEVFGRRARKKGRGASQKGEMEKVLSVAATGETITELKDKLQTDGRKHRRSK